MTLIGIIFGYALGVISAFVIGGYIAGRQARRSWLTRTGRRYHYNENKPTVEMEGKVKGERVHFLTDEIAVKSMDDGRNVKCPRCWHWHGVIENFGHTPEEIAADPQLADEKLCDSCQQLILADHPDHPSAPHIRRAMRAQHAKYKSSNRTLHIPYLTAILILLIALGYAVHRYEVARQEAWHWYQQTQKNKNHKK